MKKLGIYIKEKMAKMEKDLMERMAIQKDEEEGVDVNYKFEMINGRIRDCVTITIWTDKQYIFRTNTHELIFYDDIIANISDFVRGKQKDYGIGIELLSITDD